jgi:transposase
MVRALDPAVISVLWQAIYHLLPERVDDHPLGCHRRRVSDLVCFRGLLIRLVTGSSWETVEALMEYKVSDTTLRTRRDEWIHAGVFDALEPPNAGRLRPHHRPRHGIRGARRIDPQGPLRR